MQSGALPWARGVSRRHKVSSLTAPRHADRPHYGASARGEGGSVKLGAKAQLLCRQVGLVLVRMSGLSLIDDFQ